ncbi:MAG: AMIN domain-containing protein [Syntrophaceae bacterium]|nr:AMIN domain-containing protein [Syntrophaceae bacterium]
MKPNYIRYLITILILCFLLPFPIEAKEWGQIMFTPEKTNIRAKRTINSRLKGSLAVGQKIRADFYRDDWYAVFPMDQKIRRESLALGYVYAPRLKFWNSREHSDKLGKEGLVVSNIRFYLETDGVEKVYIELSRFSMPKIINLRGNNPRLVMDFPNVYAAGEGLKHIKVGGKMIHRIRSHLDTRKQVFRIVLDLAAGKDYMVSQKFYEAEKLYALELAEDKDMKKP